MILIKSRSFINAFVSLSGKQVPYIVSFLRKQEPRESYPCR